MKFAKRMETVKGSVIRDVAKEISDRNNPNLIRLSGGIPDGALFPMNELMNVTMQIFKNEKDGIEALQYGLTKGDTELVHFIGERMRNNEKMKIGDENILVTTGCQQGIALTAMAFLDKGDGVIIEKPSYLDGLNACIPFESELIGVNTDDEGIVIQELEEALNAHPHVKIIYVIPNFQNPTGKAWTLERRKAFMEFMSKEKYQDIIILEDNPYGEIRFRGEFIPSLKAMDERGQVVYLSSFSKVLCPGLRVAWAIGDVKIMDRLEELKEGMDLQSNQFAQSQVREYMKSYSLDDHIEKLRQSYKKKCDVMIEAMTKEFPKEVSYIVPDGGMFMWVELPKYFDTNKLLSTALDAEVAYIPGSSFFADGSGKNTMRLNFTACSSEMIVEGIRRLAEVIKKEIQ